MKTKTPTKNSHIVKNMLLSEIQEFLTEEHCDKIKCLFEKKEDDVVINNNIDRLIKKYTK